MRGRSKKGPPSLFTPSAPPNIPFSKPPFIAAGGAEVAARNLNSAPIYATLSPQKMPNVLTVCEQIIVFIRKSASIHKSRQSSSAGRSCQRLSWTRSRGVFQPRREKGNINLVFRPPPHVWLEDKDLRVRRGQKAGGGGRKKKPTKVVAAPFPSSLFLPKPNGRSGPIVSYRPYNALLGCTLKCSNKNKCKKVFWRNMHYTFCPLFRCQELGVNSDA